MNMIIKMLILDNNISVLTNNLFFLSPIPLLFLLYVIDNVVIMITL